MNVAPLLRQADQWIRRARAATVQIERILGTLAPKRPRKINVFVDLNKARRVPSARNRVRPSFTDSARVIRRGRKRHLVLSVVTVSKPPRPPKVGSTVRVGGKAYVAKPGTSAEDRGDGIPRMNLVLEEKTPLLPPPTARKHMTAEERIDAIRAAHERISRLQP